jgi:hypothetical protein
MCLRLLNSAFLVAELVYGSHPGDGIDVLINFKCIDRQQLPTTKNCPECTFFIFNAGVWGKG